ncbi:MAG: ABC transporter substrate-binding protein [Phycisphaerales bacterium]|nr:ABC transporter substrate-binding protein [Phycisphaerales bacterium]
MPSRCLFVLLFALVLAGCGEDTGDRPADRSMMVTDRTGREVEVPGKPERIAALAPFAVEMLQALGIEPVMRASVRGETPEAWSSIPELPISHGAGPEMERLVAARPDLVILPEPFAHFASSVRSATGAPVLVLDVRTLDEARGMMELLGVMTGRMDRAVELGRELDRRVAEVVADVPGDGSGEGPGVFALFGTPDAFYAFLPDSYLGDLASLLGATLVTEGLPEDRSFGGFAQFSLETVVSRDPDALLIVTHGGVAEGVIERLQRDPAWKGLRAVREGRVGVLSDDLFVLRPGASPAEAMGRLRDALYATPSNGG